MKDFTALLVFSKIVLQLDSCLGGGEWMSLRERQELYNFK